MASHFVLSPILGGDINLHLWYWCTSWYSSDRSTGNSVLSIYAPSRAHCTFSPCSSAGTNKLLYIPLHTLLISFPFKSTARRFYGPSFSTGQLTALFPFPTRVLSCLVQRTVLYGMGGQPAHVKASRLRLLSSYLQSRELQNSLSLHHFLGHRLFHFLRCYRFSPCTVYLLLRLGFVTNWET